MPYHYTYANNSESRWAGVSMNREIRLIPKTARARQIIKEWGDRWEIVRIDNVAFAEGRHALVTPISLLEGDMREQASRWVKLKNAKDFEIIS
jgi:hypothetical protein